MFEVEEEAELHLHCGMLVIGKGGPGTRDVLRRDGEGGSIARFGGECDVGWLYAGHR